MYMYRFLLNVGSGTLGHSYKEKYIVIPEEDILFWFTKTLFVDTRNVYTRNDFKFEFRILVVHTRTYESSSDKYSKPAVFGM